MLPPEKLCRKHLLGEHNEIHKMVGNLRHSRTWAESLTKLSFLEPQNALCRHNELVKEMARRGYNHNSPLDTAGVELPIGRVDLNASMKDLYERCELCGGEANGMIDDITACEDCAMEGW